MTKLFRGGAPLALIACFATTGAARADVTAQDVWAQWQSYMTSFGYTVTTQPVPDSAGLRLPAFSMTIDVPADPAMGTQGGTITMTMGDVTLVNRGDGSVSVDIPASMPVLIAGDGLDGEEFEVSGTMTTTGYSTIASGTPNDITYTFAASAMALRVDEVIGKTGRPVAPNALSVAMTDAAGTSRIGTSGTGTTVDQTLSIGQVAYDIDIQAPEGQPEGHLKAQGSYSGVTSTASGQIPASFDPMNIDQALRDGYAMNANMAFADGRTALDFADPEQAMTLNSTSKGSAFTVGMSQAGLIYDVATRDVTLDLTGSQIPFPINTTLRAFGIGVTMPVTARDEAQDFRARLTLTEATVPDQVWAMIDAGNMLPHDPLTVEIETNGKARLFANILGATAPTTPPTGLTKPGEITQLTLGKLLLKAAGATVTANGAFDVDNSARFPVNPALPAIDGQLDLRMTGVTTLLGKLGQMGLMPMPQAMMASGMIQQLGKPETGPDDLSAAITVTKDAQITINGMPLPF